jgi:hypothetical protein
MPALDAPVIPSRAQPVLKTQPVLVTLSLAPAVLQIQPAAVMLKNVRFVLTIKPPAPATPSLVLNV